MEKRTKSEIWISAKTKKVIKIVEGVYQAFIGTDANQIEINPLITTPDGDLLALDAKINFDDDTNKVGNLLKNFAHYAKHDTILKEILDNFKYDVVTKIFSNALGSLLKFALPSFR